MCAGPWAFNSVESLYRHNSPVTDSLPTPLRSRFRWLWWVVAYMSLALGVIGIALPGLPTVPFVLLSAYAAARGSDRLYKWLVAHRVFGPMILDWQRNGAVSRKAKRFAIGMMALSAVLMFLTAPKWWMAAVGTVFMLCVGIWLWRRPER